MRGRVLAVAGSDSGGGAGIQADVKTITALGGYAATAVTALTAQNTHGVRAVQVVDADFLHLQLEAVLTDIGADVVKTGMLPTAAAIEALAGALDAFAPEVPLVVDPVMVATDGTALLDSYALAALKRDLIVRATVLTPNLPEAEALIGLQIGSVEAMVHAAGTLLTLGPQAVLLKGGHLPGDAVTDVLVTHDSVEVYEAPRIDSPHTHGTGCTLASAVATGLAQGMALEAAVHRARAYLRRAIQYAPGIGGGHGPLNHAHTVAPFEPET